MNKTKITPFEALQCAILLGIMKLTKKGKPGEVIEALSPAMRKALETLTAEELEKYRFEPWMADYDRKVEFLKQFKKDKMEFDQKLKLL